MRTTTRSASTFGALLMPCIPLMIGCPSDGNGNGNGEPVSVQGTLAVSETSVVDGDTNDPVNIVVENDYEGDVTKAQSIPNPCTVGGFLGVIGSKTDVRDVYRVQMAANQTATLLLADPTVHDYDLIIYDIDGNQIEDSVGTGKAEQVHAPSNGTFLIEVFGASVDQGTDTAGLYTLLIGHDVSSTLRTALRKDRLSTRYECVEGEALVKWSPTASAKEQARLRAAKGWDLLDSGERSLGYQRIRVAPAHGTSKTRSTTAQTAGLNRKTSATIQAIKELRRRTDVVRADPNYIRKPYAVPNDPFFVNQWHYPQIGLPNAWNITTGSSDVIVAVIDTGLVLSHPDLQGQFIDGFDFIIDPDTALDGDGIDADPDDPGDSDVSGIPSSFHGTHVAGTVAARTNNGTGVAGVAWDARIMPLRALGKGGGTDFDISQCILFAARLTNTSGTIPPNRADIINMSLGGPGFSSFQQDAITAARGRGVIIVTAAGNSAANADLDSPGGLDGVVNVSAVDFNRARASYSNFGQTVAVTAPGGDVLADANSDGFPDGVLSTIGDDGGGRLFEFYDGTSMAAPHVAGVAALMRTVNPSLSPADFDQLLAGTHAGTSIAIVDDLGPAGRDINFGFGLINALNAVRAAAEIAGTAPTSAPILRVLPVNLDFAADLTQADLTVTNAGTDALSVASVTPTESWLSVDPTSGGTGTYVVSIDRTGLADGIYTGALNFASNGGTASVVVRMTVGTAQSIGGDVGTLYIILVDPASLATVAQFNASATGGYAFTFENVPQGQYLLFAGTDMDNNSFIDDQGEAFGGFPVTSDPVAIDATGNVSDLSFSINYLIYVQTPASRSSRPFAPGTLRRLHR